MVTLYIGMDDHFQQYQEEYDGTLNEQGMVPAEGVVAEMAQLTGWNPVSYTHLDVYKRQVDNNGTVEDTVDEIIRRVMG